MRSVAGRRPVHDVVVNMAFDPEVLAGSPVVMLFAVSISRNLSMLALKPESRSERLLESAHLASAVAFQCAPLSFAGSGAAGAAGAVPGAVAGAVPGAVVVTVAGGAPSGARWSSISTAWFPARR